MPRSVTDGTIDMYADDTTLTVSGTHADEIKQKLSDGVCQVMNWIDANKLVLNVDKTMVMLIGSRRKLNGIENFDVMVNGYVLKRVKVCKYFGVLIDEELHWTQQVDKVAKTVQSVLGILRRVQLYITKEKSFV